MLAYTLKIELISFSDLNKNKSFMSKLGNSQRNFLITLLLRCRYCMPNFYNYYEVNPIKFKSIYTFPISVFMQMTF